MQDSAFAYPSLGKMALLQLEGFQWQTEPAVDGELFSLLSAVAVWVVLSLLVGQFAHGRGRDSAGFFLLALIVSPLIAFIVAAAIGPGGKFAFKTCPSCAENIKREALICRYCGEKFQQGVHA